MCAFSNNLPHFDTKLPQKRSKLLQNHKTVPNLANKVDIPTFWQKLIILRGDNMGQIHTWQPVQNSAPIRRRLVEKPLKTVLFHQNDYQWPKNRRVAWLYFRCDHFEGHMYHILRTAKKKVRDLPSTHLSVVNCASAGTLPAEAESLRPLRGRLNKSGSRRITARSSLGYAYHTVLLPPLCSHVQSIQMGF